MKPIDLAYAYMKIVFETMNYEGLKEILADDFTFQGPFFSASTAQSYIEAMQKDPLINASYKVLKAYHQPKSVCLIYEFSKFEMKTIMSQIFDVEDGEIKSILLIFDATAFPI